MIGKKNCEGCSWYQPLDTFGICDLDDGRVNADPGGSCKHWSDIKYNRTEYKKQTKFELKMANQEMEGGLYSNVTI